MNLVLDIGNTCLKYAIFDKGELKEHSVIDNKLKFEIQKIIKEKNIRRSIVSFVVSHPPAFINILKERTFFLELTSETKIPVKNLYKTPHTLGNDRLAAVIGAQKKFPENNILVIDAGTCLKYNFITAEAEFIGGGISPGIDMRFKALNILTDKLPLIDADPDFNTLIGTSSRDSILSGVLMGILEEVKGIISEYEKQYPDLKVVFTGGNHSFFDKHLKNSIFTDPFLILKGLNDILEYNSK